VELGLGRIVALHHRSSTSYRRFVNIFGTSFFETTLRPNPRWSTTFKQAIGEIGHTVMVLSPWSA
jgi:hypothetical protein